MGKQRCASCRFFEDVGIAGSGWCHHPLRRTTGDLLIMVRGNELACRDQWSRSLWEEGSFKPDAGGGARQPAALPPLSPGEFARFVERGAGDAAGGEPQDVVLGEARLVGNATPPWRRTTLDDITAESASLALEAVPANSPAFARLPLAARRGAEREAGDLPFAPDYPAAPPAEQEDRELAARHDREDAADGAPLEFEWGSAGVEPAEVIIEETIVLEVDDDLWLEDKVEEPEPVTANEDGAVPGPADHATGGAPATRDRRAGEAPAGGIGDAPVARAGRGSGEAPVEPRPVWEHTRERAASELAGDERRLESSYDESGTGGGEIRPGPRAGGRFGWLRGRGEAGDLYRGGAAGGYAGTGRLVDPSGEVPVRRPEPDALAARVETGGLGNLNGRGGSAAPSGLGDHDLVIGWDGGAAAVWTPEPVSVAPALPRICRTCRDFRAGENGGSGWCANAWAFPHRQVVTADAAPACESAVGSWWLPTDELRIEPVDVTAHAQDTPLLDQWLPGRKVTERQRRES